MNVDDVEKVDDYDDMLRRVFARQLELMLKYHPIEVRSGIGSAVLAGEEFNIDTPRGQALCKDYAWRVTEEVAEATEAAGNGQTDHAREEIADSFHFLVELLLLNRVTIGEVLTLGFGGFNGDDEFRFMFESTLTAPFLSPRDPYALVETLGLAMNCLKQKPWKQSHVLTDQRRYRTLLCVAVKDWVRFARAAGMDAEMAFDFYYRKSEVNKFRQRSQY